VLSVAVHPDGTAFATGSSDSKVKLWDLQTRSCAQTVTEHSDQVWGVAFRADGSRLASVSDDKSVALFDFT
jgi:WD repeat-containing protein 61